MRGPLTHLHDRLQARFTSADSEGDGALQRVRVVGGHVVGPLGTAQRVEELVRVEEVRHCHLGTSATERLGAAVQCPHHGTYGKALGQQLSDHRTAGLARRTGYQNRRVGCHHSLLLDYVCHL